MCAAADVDPADVRRLRWVDDAFRDAARVRPHPHGRAADGTGAPMSPAARTVTGDVDRVRTRRLVLGRGRLVDRPGRRRLRAAARPGERPAAGHVAGAGRGRRGRRRDRRRRQEASAGAGGDRPSRLGTATLFGGGTLVVVRQPGWIARESAGKARLAALIARRRARQRALLRGARRPGRQGARGHRRAARGGRRRRAAPSASFPAIGRERMLGWLERRAGELGIRLGPGAAQLLAERVGATVREGDVDRRRQIELANGELEKLALYRPDGTVSREDVADLVAEAIPGSTWAFLDALAARRGGEAARLARAVARRWHAAARAHDPDPSPAARAHRGARPPGRRHATAGPGQGDEAAAVPGPEAARSRRRPGPRRSWSRRWRAWSSWTCAARASASTGRRSRCRTSGTRSRSACSSRSTRAGRAAAALTGRR